MISALRQNSLEVLVSPRVRTIPKSYRVTVFTHLFIILISLAAAFTYTYISSSTACQARPLSDELENGQFDCAGLTIRREFAAQLELSNNTLTITPFKIFQDIELQLDIAAPQFISNEFSELQLDPDLMGVLSRVLLRILGVSATLGSSLPFDPTHESFTETFLLETAGAPGLDVRIVPQGSIANFDLSLFTLNSLGAIPTTSPLLNISADEYTLAILYTTQGGLKCLVQYDFEPLNAQSRLRAACFSPENFNGKSAIKFSYVGKQTIDAFQAAESMLVFLQSMHGELYGNDDSAFELVEQIFATNFFFCCFPDNLDEVEYFGIFSGLMFFLEGVFTFVFVAVVFRGRISGNEKAFDDNKRHSFAYSFREGQVEEVNIKAAILEDEELEKRGVRNVGRGDIVRVLFNPRCRYIPYASIVSILSLTVLMGVSSVLALWYQALRTVKVCEPTPVNDLSASTPNCESLGVTNVYYEAITTGPITLPLKITAQLSVDESEVTTFDPNSVFNQPVVDAFSGCTGVGLLTCTSSAYNGLVAALPSAMITNSTEFDAQKREFLLNIDHVIPGAIEETSFNFEMTVRVEFEPGALVAANATVLQRIFQIRWNVLRLEKSTEPLEPPKVLVEYGADFATNFIGQERVLDPFDNGGDITKGIIETIGSFGGAADLIVTPVGDTFVQCCGTSSLEFYDYLGLMMGYIALFEGILTFLCAFVLYELVRALFKFRSCFK